MTIGMSTKAIWHNLRISAWTMVGLCPYFSSWASTLAYILSMLFIDYNIIYNYNYTF